jgi:hypothetical protein
MRTHPLKDEDIVPGEWTHRQLQCDEHGDTRHAACETGVPGVRVFECVQCMRDEQICKLPCLPEPLPPFVPDEKPTNPKDACAIDRAPLGIVPLPALVEESLALFEGLLKYGAHNYTIKGVRASVYVFACGRHLLKYYFGQNRDTTTGVHHLGNARACLAVLLDAEHRGKLEDDRPPALPEVDALFEHAATVMRGLIALYGGRNPRHYTIADTEPKG